MKTRFFLFAALLLTSFAIKAQMFTAINLMTPHYYPGEIYFTDGHHEEFAEIEKGITKLDGYAEGLKFEIVRTSKSTKRKDEQIIILKDKTGEYTENNEDNYILGIAYFPKTKTKIQDYNGKVYINKNIELNVIEKTTMHEILHILDFGHENNFKSIMSPCAGHVSTQPTQKDIENINKKFPAAEQEQ